MIRLKAYNIGIPGVLPIYVLLYNLAGESGFTWAPTSKI